MPTPVRMKFSNLLSKQLKEKSIYMILHKRIYIAVVIMACMLSLGGASAYAESPNIILILVVRRHRSLVKPKSHEQAKKS